MKKFFAWILAIAMTLSLAACGGNNSDQDDSSQQGDLNFQVMWNLFAPLARAAAPTCMPVPLLTSSEN